MKKIFTILLSIIFLIIINIVMNVKFISIHYMQVSDKFIPCDEFSKILITPNLSCDDEPIMYSTYGEKSTVISDNLIIKSIVNYLNSIPLKSTSEMDYVENKGSTITITFLDSSQSEVAYITVSDNNYISDNNSFKYKSYFENVDIIGVIEKIYRGDETG